MPIVQIWKPRLSQAEGHWVHISPKTCTCGCKMSQSPRTGQGFSSSWSADITLLGCAPTRVPATHPPTHTPPALLAALVPGARRHIVCRSIILSGLPGSHYFTAVIIYSSTEPSACGWALTLMSLTAGQEPHSGRINHQPRRRGACIPRDRRSCYRHRGPVNPSIFPWRNLLPGVSEGDEP